MRVASPGVGPGFIVPEPSTGRRRAARLGARRGNSATVRCRPVVVANGGLALHGMVAAIVFHFVWTRMKGAGLTPRCRIEAWR